MLVRGSAGIGKTALIHEVLRGLTRQKGYFASGKFDQLQRHVPLAAPLQAYRGLIRQLLTEPETRLQYWRDRFLANLGSNGQLMVEAIPELELMIGKQPPVPELGAIEAANRLTRTFIQFVRTLPHPEHPLVIFMDDVQWADIASLQSLQAYMAEADHRYHLIIYAYRDNEVNSTHPLSQSVEAMRQLGTIVTEIQLEPLPLERVTQLVAETLHRPVGAVAPLASLLFEKTSGNPFFLIQLLRTLSENHLIWFEVITRTWQWNLEQIQQQGITDNVVELMIRKIAKLPLPTQYLLQLAACIGSQFDLPTVAIVAEQPLGQVAQSLWDAIQAGLIVPMGTGYRLPQVLDAAEISDALTQGTTIEYQFLHDRVQQAAYSLIPSDRTPLIHHHIGQLLLQKIPIAQRENKIFDIVNQLNMGVSLLDRPEAREELAQLNLLAGRKAKTAAAYAAALDYVQTGISLLTPTCWHDRYAFTLQLYEIAVEVAYLTGHFGQMAIWVEIFTQQTHTILDRIKVIQVTIQSYAARNQHLAGITLALDTLEKLGVSLPRTPSMAQILQEFSQVQLALQQHNPGDLLHLPEMAEPDKLAASQILANISGVTAIAEPILIPITLLHHIRLLLNYGNSPFAAHAYCGYGILTHVFLQDSETTYQFGQLALQLVERSQTNVLNTKIFQLVGAYTIHWTSHLREALPFFDRAIVSGPENGDLEFAGYAAMTKCQYLYFLGQELTELNQTLIDYNQTLGKLNQTASASRTQILQQAVLNLSTPSHHPWDLTGDLLKEMEFVEKIRAVNDRLGLHYFYSHKLILSTLFGEYEQGLANSKQAELYLDGVEEFFNVPIFYFYDALVRLQNWDAVTDGDRAEFLEKIDANQDKLQSWARQAPMNFQHKKDLVAAEKQRVLGQYLEAMDLYDRAIMGARENNYIQEEALASELAARFYLAQGRTRIAQAYLTDAYEAYDRWGAKAKVIDLETRYPTLVPDHRVGGSREVRQWLSSSDSYSSSARLLDLATVFKASQAIAQEIHLERLLTTLMQVVMENAGAQTGILLLKEEEQWQIAIHCTALQFCSLQSKPMQGSQDIPVTVVHYVENTQTIVVIDVVAMPTPFTADPYWRKRQPQSVLCAPIVNQARLMGMLYLENWTTGGTFTHDWQELVQLIASQAAISLENARLYSTLERKVNDRTQDLSQALAHLQATQQELIQSEKMAALGQLTASVAHEINTPLGVIRSAISNIMAAFSNSLQQLPSLLQRLSPQQQSAFLTLVKAALQEQQAPSTKAERQRQRHLQTILAEQGILDAESIATQLTLLRLGQNLAPYQSILSDPNCSAILQVAYNLVLQNQNANCIQQEVDRAGKIVFALKTYSHHNASREESLTPITDSIEVALTLYQRHFKQDIEMIRCYAAEVPKVRCNPDELTQVWVNLVDNAIDAMGQKGTLEITVTQTADRGVVAITDSGCGISPDIQSHIFEPFFTTKPRGEGSGLGLHIVRQIVDKHAGEIQVHSQPGRTTFTIQLPLPEIAPSSTNSHQPDSLMQDCPGDD
ncbi:hypothetical protein BST81_05005 [Leptolyngbya sp. 'hensonii']|uniref:trifunctional serine/threonine-protein kinase/ATP-binding protein/sensor histidine kinase n=1 Tax=Leptolyngbya sp. 'hensonii' TaxID=1922337 RepID=UPI00094F499F|nr:AAA family ATPase [Leptolyngbya sp. 'hensonii']OLP19619.1 hypothetical protein BST81_05005 [Leptolyngbya sp. 'hensonii']